MTCPFKTTVFALILVLSGTAAADDPAVRRGRRDYQRYCLSCHGRDGDGHGPSAQRYLPLPRDFTAANFKCRSTPTGALATDQDLRHSIVRGMHGTGMPSWSTLSEFQLRDLIVLIKSFSPRWQKEEVPAPTSVPAEPATSADSVARGKEVFMRMQCFTCHGEQGHGNGPALANLHDESGNLVRPADLTRREAFKCGDAPSRIYLSIMNGLSGSPMPAFGEALTLSEAWDLVHYLRALPR